MRLFLFQEQSAFSISSIVKAMLLCIQSDPYVCSSEMKTGGGKWISSKGQIYRATVHLSTLFCTGLRSEMYSSTRSPPGLLFLPRCFFSGFGRDIFALRSRGTLGTGHQPRSFLRVLPIDEALHAQAHQAANERDSYARGVWWDPQLFVRRLGQLFLRNLSCVKTSICRYKFSSTSDGVIIIVVVIGRNRGGIVVGVVGVVVVIIVFANVQRSLNTRWKSVLQLFLLSLLPEVVL